MTQATPFPDQRRRAHSIATYFCDHCDNLHIALKDERGRIYTEAVLSDEMVLNMVRQVVERNQEIIDEMRGR